MTLADGASGGAFREITQVMYKRSVKALMKSRIALLAAALMSAAVVQPIAPAQEETAAPVEVTEAESLAVMKHAADMVIPMMPEMITYLREVKDKESADRAALRFAVDKVIMMGIGECLDTLGYDMKEMRTPEMMAYGMEFQKLESAFFKNKHYGSTLMAYAWDHAYGMELAEPTAEEKAAAAKLLDEQDTKKTEDILATVHDLETADTAAHALVEKLIAHQLLTTAGHAPKERQRVSLSNKEAQQIEALHRAKFHGSLLLSIVASELMYLQNQPEETEDSPETLQVPTPAE